MKKECILCETELRGEGLKVVSSRHDIIVCQECTSRLKNTKISLKQAIAAKRYYMHHFFKNFPGFNPRKREFVNPDLTQMSKTMLKHYNTLTKNYKYSVLKTLF